jgi:hypothetical protein
MLRRATFIPASARAKSDSRVLEVGPMVQTILVFLGKASIPPSSLEVSRWSMLSAVASAAKPEDEDEEVRSSRRERVLPSALALRRALGAAAAAAWFSAAASAASSASWTPVL